MGNITLDFKKAKGTSDARQSDHIVFYDLSKLLRLFFLSFFKHTVRTHCMFGVYRHYRMVCAF